MSNPEVRATIEQRSEVPAPDEADQALRAAQLKLRSILYSWRDNFAGDGTLRQESYGTTSVVSASPHHVEIAQTSADGRSLVRSAWSLPEEHSPPAIAVTMHPEGQEPYTPEGFEDPMVCYDYLSRILFNLDQQQRDS